MERSEIRNIQIGTRLRVDDIKGEVIGYIVYKNRKDQKHWTEYRLKTSDGEHWLSIDTDYNEYSLSWPANYVKENIGPEWHEVDRGTQVVVQSRGDVDTDYGEKAIFIEFEDETEEKILSVEQWSDGTEYSEGEYLDLDEIEILGQTKSVSSTVTENLAAIAILGGLAIFIGLIIFFSQGNKKLMLNYIRNSSDYSYVTSITGPDDQIADVYEYTGYENLYQSDLFIQYVERNITTDEVAKDIIENIDGDIEVATQRKDEEDNDVAIVTEDEYCLVYHPLEEKVGADLSDGKTKVYVQISNRKYNYSSDAAPYRSSYGTSHWYRSHYYSSSYASDSSKFKKTPSPYKMYQGDTIHNIGNGYFDSYSNSIRQGSIGTRDSSAGGLGSGK